MGDSPPVELIGDRLDQCLAAPVPLAVGPHRVRPEKANAAPSRCEIRTHQLAILFRGKARDMLRTEAAIHVVAIGHEILWIRRAQERPEGGAADAPRSWQISLAQEPYADAHFRLRVLLCLERFRQSRPLAAPQVHRSDYHPTPATIHCRP